MRLASMIDVQKLVLVRSDCTEPTARKIMEKTTSSHDLSLASNSEVTDIACESQNWH